tara:strand:- start:345 stop:518 length:174 start_codon:yes stop_codon:yes gene_type:complete
MRYSVTVPNHVDTDVGRLVIEMTQANIGTAAHSGPGDTKVRIYREDGYIQHAVDITS